MQACISAQVVNVPNHVISGISFQDGHNFIDLPHLVVREPEHLPDLNLGSGCGRVRTFEHLALA